MRYGEGGGGGRGGAQFPLTAVSYKVEKYYLVIEVTGARKVLHKVACVRAIENTNFLG